MNASLHYLTEEYEVLQDMLYDGEADEQVIRDTMEAIFGEIEDKAESYAKIIKGMNADINILEAEEKRMYARRAALDKRQKMLKNTLMENMRAIGKTKIKTALFTINIAKNGGVDPLVIEGSLDDIPGKYLIPQPPKVNNEAVRQLLSEKQVDWAHLEPRGEHLGIR